MRQVALVRAARAEEAASAERERRALNASWAQQECDAHGAELKRRAALLQLRDDVEQFNRYASQESQATCSQIC